MHDWVRPIDYYPGIFDKYKVQSNLDKWTELEFPELMWGLGYEMDCEKSFEEYIKHSSLKIKAAKNDREEKKNILYLLEHAERKIVGDYLFSHFRYLTHWAYSYNAYDVDFLRRIIRILEDCYPKKQEHETIDDFVKRIHFPKMELYYDEGTYVYYIDATDYNGEDVGVPTVIFEDKHTNTFEVCDSDVTFEVMDKKRDMNE